VSEDPAVQQDFFVSPHYKSWQFCLPPGEIFIRGIIRGLLKFGIDWMVPFAFGVDIGN
jgi:hypothetical protein